MITADQERWGGGGGTGGHSNTWGAAGVPGGFFKCFVYLDTASSSSQDINISSESPQPYYSCLKFLKHP